MVHLIVFGNIVVQCFRRATAAWLCLVIILYTTTAFRRCGIVALAISGRAGVFLRMQHSVEITCFQKASCKSHLARTCAETEAFACWALLTLSLAMVKSWNHCRTCGRTISFTTSHCCITSSAIWSVREYISSFIASHHAVIWVQARSIFFVCVTIPTFRIEGSVRDSRHVNLLRLQETPWKVDGMCGIPRTECKWNTGSVVIAMLLARL